MGYAGSVTGVTLGMTWATLGGGDIGVTLGMICLILAGNGKEEQFWQERGRWENQLLNCPKIVIDIIESAW